MMNDLCVKKAVGLQKDTKMLLQINEHI